MLRHFAVLTAAVTVCLAMFASGENSGAAQALIQAKARSTAIPAAQLGPGRREVREVGGLKLAAGTRLDGRHDDYDTETTRDVGQGNLVYADPASARADEATSPAAGSQAIEIARDASGVVAPSVTAAVKRGPNAAQPAPRRATQQDYERMMAESERRSGPAGGITGE